MTTPKLPYLLARRWRVALLVSAAALTGSVVLLHLRTEHFAATSTVLIAPDPAALERVSEAVPSPAYQSFRSKRLSLEERPIATRAVSLMRGELDFGHPMFEQPEVAEKLEALRAHYRESSENTDPQHLVQELNRRTSTRQIRRAQLVEVSVADSDPSVALLSSWALAEAAEQFHSERLLAPTLELRGRQLQRLEEIEAELAEARSRHDALLENRPQLGERKRALRTALEELWTEQDQLRAELVLREKQVANEDEPVAIGEPPVDQIFAREVAKLSESLDREIMALTELQELESEAAPRVHRAERKIAIIREQLDQLQDPVAERARSRSLLVEQIQAEENEIRVRLDAVEEVLGDFEQEHAELSRTNTALTPIRLEILLLESIQRRIRGQLLRYESIGMWPSGSVTPFELARAPVPIPPLGNGRWFLILAGCLLLGVGVVTLQEVSDPHVYPDRLATRQSIPTLAHIPRASSSTAIADALFPLVPVIDTLRRHGSRGFAVVSAQPGDGRTTIVEALVRQFAQRGDNVATLDAQRPDSLSRPNHAHSDQPIDPLLVDGPALEVSGAVLSLRAEIDGAFFVVNPNQTVSDDLDRSLAMLETANIPVIGFILNEPR